MQSESEAGARLHGKRRGPADGDLKRQTRLYQSAGRDEQLAAGQRDPRGARRVRGDFVQARQPNLSGHRPSDERKPKKGLLCR